MIRKRLKSQLRRRVSRVLRKKRKNLIQKRLTLKSRLNHKQRRIIPTKRSSSRRKGRRVALKRLPKNRSARRRILIIDQSVPLYDQDTGSRNIYQFVQLFVRMGLDVKFFGADGIRHEPYTSALERLGVEVLSNRFKGQQLRTWLRKHRRTLAYTYILRPNIANDYMNLVRKNTKAKIIYNGVDFHYLRELRKYEIDQNPDTLASSRRFKLQEFKIFAKSDVVYTVSEYEKAILEVEMPGKRVVVIPTYMYEQPFPLGENNSFAERKAITFVGGFAHLPNVDGILWFVREVIPLIAREIPDITINVIGSNPPAEIVSLGNEQIRVTGYISDEALHAYYSTSKVVVAPIRFGAGVKGKIIEACAYGVPVVTTTIGAEGIIDVNNIVINANTPDSFASQIVDLYRNEQRWSAIRNNQIQYAERYMSLKYAISILSQDLGGV